VPTGAVADGPVGCRYQILGPLEVEVAGQPVDAGPPKQRAVLGLLLLHANRVVSVDTIIDDLWGDEPPPRALGSLQAYVSNLRRILEPDRSARGQASVLVTKAPGYLLRVGRDALDVFQFERLAAVGKQALDAGRSPEADAVLHDALSLWRGELLAEFADEPFAVAERARLGEIRALAEEDRSEALLRLGRHAAAVAELERLAAAQPYRERRWEQYIVALYRSDRQADALRAYQQARQTLGEELGIDPGPSLRRLEAAVLNHDPALDWHLAESPVEPGHGPAAAELTPEPSELTLAEGDAEAAAAPPLVGRHAELAELEGRLPGGGAGRAARPGRPGVVLVAGEAGIGKTSLVEELAALAARRGCTVAWGRCPEAEGAPPLWPWARVLEHLGRPDLDHADPANFNPADPAPSAHAARLVPDPATTDPTDPARAERSSFQLFNAVAGSLVEESQARPLLIILDDLHWADASSLALLVVLAERLRAEAGGDGSGARDLSVVATFRDTETRAALRDTLAALARTPGHHRITLQGLASPDVIELAARTAGAPVDSAMAEQLRSRTDGNPFFLTELIKLLASERRLGPANANHAPSTAPGNSGIPAVVADVIRSRLARLPDDTRAVLTIAAVAGRDFDLPVVQHAAGLDEDHLLDLVDGAIVTGLLTDDPNAPARVRFNHALVRETLYHDLVGLRRTRLHRRVAEALEAQPNGADRYVDELAHHYRAAGATAAALDYTCRAAGRAAAHAAHAEAARYWTAAVPLLDDAAPTDRRRRYEILHGLAQSQRLLPDPLASRLHYREAARLAAEEGDLLSATTSAVAGGNAISWNWTGYRTDEPYVELLEQLIQRVGEGEPHLRSLLLSTLAMEYTARAKPQLGPAAEEALTLARQVGEPDVLFAALHASFAARQGTPEAAGRLALARELTEVASMPPPARATARLIRIQARLECGDLDVEDDLAEAARLAELSFQPTLSSYVNWNRSLLALARGPLDDAEVAMNRALEANVLLDSEGIPAPGTGPGDDAGNAYHQAQLFTLRSLQGRLSELEPLVPLLVATDTPGLRESGALILAIVGRRDDARRALVGEEKGLPRLARDYTFLVTACGRANAIALIGDQDLAAEALAELEPYAGQFAVLDAGVCLGAVDQYLGELAATAGDSDAAIRHLRAGVELNDRAGARTWAALGRMSLGRLLDAAGDPEGAELLAEGRRAAAALGVAAY
jgi:DNA-binding SARP family transcriptional activator